MKPVPGPLTIRDVAREARVGVGTVSRVLNGGANVSPSTRSRVLAVIRRLDFRPHAQARRILRRRSEMVCFLLSNREFIHSFHARVLQGVETCASRLKQHVIYAVTHYDPGTPPSRIVLPPVLEERGWVDGLVLAGLVYTNFIRRIQALDMPFVALGNNVVGADGADDFDMVGFDEYKGVLDAAHYLISQGHTRIAFAGDVFYPWIQQRHRAYLAALESHRLSPVNLTSRREIGFPEYGEWAASRLLSMRPRPTAMMAGNDEIAFGIWRALRRHDVAIPGQVSLVGFDDREEAGLMDPPLTTVRVHKEALGEALVKSLLEKLHRPGPPFSKQTISTELVIRASVRAL